MGILRSSPWIFCFVAVVVTLWRRSSICGLGSFLSALIHRSAWRDCPKRGTNNALSANLDVLGGKNGSKSAVLVLCKATGQAPLTLFGQSRKRNSANFAPEG